MPALFLDTAPRPRARAKALAEAMRARYLPLPYLDAAVGFQPAGAIARSRTEPMSWPPPGSSPLRRDRGRHSMAGGARWARGPSRASRFTGPAGRATASPGSPIRPRRSVHGHRARPAASRRKRRAPVVPAHASEHRARPQRVSIGALEVEPELVRWDTPRARPFVLRARARWRLGAAPRWSASARPSSRCGDSRGARCSRRRRSLLSSVWAGRPACCLARRLARRSRNRTTARPTSALVSMRDGDRSGTGSSHREPRASRRGAVDDGQLESGRALCGAPPGSDARACSWPATEDRAVPLHGAARRREGAAPERPALEVIGGVGHLLHEERSDRRSARTNPNAPSCEVGCKVGRSRL